MDSLTFEAVALGILAACEVIARSLWPELFEDRPAGPPEAACPSEAAEAAEEHHRDEMAIW